jgi:hypothetical protein
MPLASAGNAVIVVGATLTHYAMAHRATWASWLDTAEGLQKHSPEPLKFFAAIEVDGRGEAPFAPLISRLQELDSDWWIFRLDDGRTEASTAAARLPHICAGRNLIAERATALDASHVLYLDADCCPPADTLPKLLELDWPYVGGEVPTYCLHGEPLPGLIPVEEHMPVAAFLLVRREIFKRLRWRSDLAMGMHDDACYHRDAEQLLGIRARVRKDVIGRHYPESIGPIETRFPGRDMSVR